MGRALLLQPHGFEGLSPREEGLDPCDLSVAEEEELGELLVDLDPAAASLQINAPEPENGIANVTNVCLLQAHAVPFPYLPERSRRLGDLFDTAIRLCSTPPGPAGSHSIAG